GGLVDHHVRGRIRYAGIIPVLALEPVVAGAAAPQTMGHGAGDDRHDGGAEPVVARTVVGRATAVGVPVRLILDPDDPIPLAGAGGGPDVLVEVGGQGRGHAEAVHAGGQVAALVAGRAAAGGGPGHGRVGAQGEQD